MLDYDTLRIAWWLFIGVLLIGFTLMDGRHMGVGILLPFVARNESERRAVVDSLAAPRQGGRIWLLSGAGALCAVWPLVGIAAFCGFYWAMLAILGALLLHPLGFDRRGRFGDPRWRGTWDWALFLGGATPPLIFGIAFGNLLQGVPFHFDETLISHHTGSFRTLLNPFALLCGAVSLAMFSFHGGIYLCRHAQGGGDVRRRAAHLAYVAALVMLAAFFAGGVWIATGVSGYRLTQDAAPLFTPFGKNVLYSSGAWLHSYYRAPATLLLPLLPYFAAAAALRLLRRGRASAALNASTAAIVGIIGTAGAAMFPFIMPSSTHPAHSLTLWNSASSPATLTFMLGLAAVFIPLIVLHTRRTRRMTNDGSA